MSNAELIEGLDRNRLMKTTEESIAFDQALQGLAERRQDSDLPQLLRVFDDRTEHLEVMWALVHLVEAYDATAYASAFVDCLPETLPAAREWMEALALGQLNQDEARTLLLGAGRRADSDAARALAALLTQIAAGEDPVASLARQVLDGLGRHVTLADAD